MEFDGPAGTDRALLALGLGVESLLETLPAPSVERVQAPRI
jgi:hypothetical protein